MSTSYGIRAGYNANHKEDVVWQELCHALHCIQDDPEKIVEEVMRLEPNADRDEIKGVAELYREPVEDLTIGVRSFDGVDWIIQLSTGGNPGRAAKESCRRAVCRLLIDHMHGKQMEVCMIVS